MKSSCSPEETAYLRKLGNPYAKLSILDEPDMESLDPVRAFVKKSQNPYASLQVCLESELEERPSTAKSLAFDNKPAPRVSKEVFERGCRRIFEQYTPLREAGRKLDGEYVSFISENGNRPAEERAQVLSELQKYDLSFLGKVTPYLNRERKDALKAKLKRLGKTS